VRKVLTLLKWVVALLGLVVLVLVVVLAIVDFGRFKPELEQAVTEATGREFRIDGGLKIRLLPSIRVAADDVSMANADWGSEPQMVDIGHFSAEVSPWSLFSGPPVIKELIVRDVDVLLEARDDGTANWAMGEPAPTEPPPGDGDESESASLEMPVDIRFADISNVTVKYRPAATAETAETEDTEVTIDSLDVTVNEAGQHVIDGKGQWMEWPLSLAALAGNRKVELDAAAGELAIHSTVDYPADTVDVTAVFTTLDKIGQLVEVEGLPVGELSLSGKVGVRGDTIRLSNVVAGLGSTELAIDGEVGGDGSAQLAITAAGPSLSELDPGLPELPFDLSTNLVVAGQSATFDPFELNFGDSDLRGSARLEAGETTRVELRATSALIDLTPFESSEPEAEEDGEAAEAEDPPEPAAAEQAAGTDSRYVFTEEPLPLDQLRSLKADIEVSVDRLKTAAVNLQDLAIVLTAEDGRIDFDNSFRGSAGGEAKNRVGLIAGADTAELTVKAGGRGIKLGLMSGPDLPEAQRPSTNLDIDIRSRGATARALAASTNGRVVLTQGAGRVANDVMSRVSGDVIAQLFEALNPLAKTEKFVNWECSAVALDFTDGVGEMTAFLLQSEKLMIVAGGGVDLNTEKLNFEFNTKPRDGVGLSADMFVTPFVKLSGTLASPGVGLNAKGALLSGGAAVMTGGLSFLYQGLMDRATAQGDRCPEVLEQVGMPEVAGSD
jgi:uncharacterized protein involved in outer membrane biogenesis